jgi:hypothetical protein
LSGVPKRVFPAEIAAVLPLFLFRLLSSHLVSLIPRREHFVYGLKHRNVLTVANGTGQLLFVWE